MGLLEYFFLEDEQDLNGVENVSLVDGPAYRKTFLALSEKKKNITTLDTERRMVIGPVMIPGEIPGTPEKGEKGFISAKTISKIQEHYTKKGKQGNVSIHHDEKLNGCYMTQTWIVDRANGVMAGHGFDSGKNKVEDGTWMGAMKIDNDEVWHNDIKAGEVDGFSVDVNLTTLALSEDKNSLDNHLEQINKISKWLQ